MLLLLHEGLERLDGGGGGRIGVDQHDRGVDGEHGVEPGPHLLTESVGRVVDELPAGRLPAVGGGVGVAPDQDDVGGLVGLALVAWTRCRCH